MNWADIGASGEVIGAVAVVLTLIYLSVQLRQNTRSSELAALQGFFDATSALNRDRGKLEDGLLRAGLSDWHSLANNDKAKLDAYFADFASQIHRGYRLHQKGILDEETYSTWEASLLALLNEPGGAIWWSSMVSAEQTTSYRFVDCSVSVSVFKQEALCQVSDERAKNGKRCSPNLKRVMKARPHSVKLTESAHRISTSVDHNTWNAQALRS